MGVDLEWVESTGRGSIVTFTIIGRAQTPAFIAPYVVAVVRLDEGYEMLTNIVDATPDRVQFGSRVEVEFVRESDEISLPCFRLAA
ncbi:OB-fold domain-containing protein [Sphaerisporangium sp. NPDC051011]|uniref:Zn-ribbon domain-containing OB-fold protein n=1 Tax=Sphaerisporangium sp. NPDC051011 TaxID=3155792 RepID=UPI00340AC2D3